MVRSATLLPALICALSACAPAATFVAREGKCPTRPLDCSFAIISGKSPERYEVVGVIDVESFVTRKLPNDEASFRAAISREVCRAGGDAVIAGINGDGRYILATVVKWSDGSSQTPACPKPKPDAGAPKPDASAPKPSNDASTAAPKASASDAGALPDAEGS
jgi:hypothetical protein